MRLLGIDTSGSVAAAALYDTEADLLLGQQQVFTKRTHSQVILPLVERLLADAGLTIQDVDQIGVAAGPGSYTGLRIGVAACKAMCYVRQIPCCGVSTLKALACQADAAGDRYICAVMKARQRLAYAGIYAFQDGMPTVVMADEVLTYEALAEKLQALHNEGKALLLTGDDAAAFQADMGISYAALAPAGMRLQNGYGICRAMMTEEAVTPEMLEARYLQLVKAEKDRQDKMEQSAK